MVFNAYVSDKDITGIKTGDKVHIKIPAYDDTEYENMSGTIIEIRDMPISLNDKSTAYNVKVAIENAPDDMVLGMNGQVDIVIGSRTIMEYFLEPFEKLNIKYN